MDECVNLPLFCSIHDILVRKCSEFPYFNHSKISVRPESVPFPSHVPNRVRLAICFDYFKIGSFPELLITASFNVPCVGSLLKHHEFSVLKWVIWVENSKDYHVLCSTSKKIIIQNHSTCEKKPKNRLRVP